MSIKQEDLEAAGRLVGEELARTDLDWGAWNEEHKGEGGGSKGDGGSKGAGGAKSDAPAPSAVDQKASADVAGHSPAQKAERSDVESALGIKFDDAASKTMGTGAGRVTQFVKSMPKGSGKAVKDAAVKAGFTQTSRPGDKKNETTFQKPNGNILRVRETTSGFKNVFVEYYSSDRAK